MRTLIIAEGVGGLSPHQVGAEIAARCTRDEVTLVAITTGGTGTASCFNGETIVLPTVDPAGALTEASYVFDPATQQAYIDVCAHPCDPATSDTYGTGVLIADAVARGANRIILATGGVHTRDGGTGILIALGAQPLDAAGHPVKPGQQGLATIASIDTAQLNVPAACAEWVLLIDAALQPADPAFAEFCDVPDGLGIGMGILWLSKLMHQDTEHVHILPGAQTLMETFGVPELINATDRVVAVTSPDSPTLGLLNEFGATNVQAIVVAPGETLDQHLA
ncbi:glycerate kinase [Corynebacterium sp.]|uniref:glycerate kinase n=1 Tax=Corynebacterium sp. TaxID=1720 RepID=UPI0026DA7B18|nr:glycerate kinase [Corynebacterium sp.]MDO5075858.1 glycerate kinase [Corynebacterium sp.]